MTSRTSATLLEAWQEELASDAHGLAWFAPTAIARLKIIPWEEGFGAVIARGARILDWGKIP